MNRLSSREIARSISFVPQQTVVSHGFTAFEIVLMGRFPYKSMVALENSEDLEIAGKMMKETGAESFAHRRFDTLSGGEQQRVILASALAQEPSILLLDEPISALDVYYQVHIFNVLKKLNRTLNLTIVLAVHDLNYAARLCNRIWLINDQNILDGAPAEVLLPEVLAPIFRVEMKQLPFGLNENWLVPDFVGGIHN